MQGPLLARACHRGQDLAFGHWVWVGIEQCIGSGWSKVGLAKGTGPHLASHRQPRSRADNASTPQANCRAECVAAMCRFMVRAAGSEPVDAVFGHLCRTASMAVEQESSRVMEGT